MKTVVVIPTYWTRERKEGLKEFDIPYDHPTPLDEEGTLRRAVESFNILNNKNFDLLIIAVPTAQDIEDRVEERVRKILEEVDTDFALYLSGPSHIKEVKNLLESYGDTLDDLLSLYGYSPVRNTCIFVPFSMGADVVVLIDDDEVVEDPQFLDKALEYIGREIEGHEVLAKAGYYLQADGDYLLKKELRPYMVYWDQYEKMNEAFRIFIGRAPRLKIAPFVFGGNMVLHRKIIKEIPFDPGVPRGEDIDYLINAKMFGYEFFLDNELAVKHLPPPKPHPLWKQLRIDMVRFLWEREKLRRQRPVPGMREVKAEELDPYPGCFLKDNFEEKVVQANKVLALEYLVEDKKADAREALQNIVLLKTGAIPSFDPFEGLLRIQNRWKKVLGMVEGELEKFKHVVERIK